MNIKDENKEIETGEDFDTVSALAEISSELFGQDSKADLAGGESESEGLEPDTEKVLVGDEAPAPKTATIEGETLASEDNSAEVQALGAPKTWTKEALAEWAKIPPLAQQQIMKREEDMFKGLAEYKGRAEVGDRYSEVVQPYDVILKAEGVDPIELFKNFAGNHYLLRRGTQEQKLSVFKNFVDFYRIDIPSLIGMIDNAAEVDPNTRALRERLDRIEAQNRSAQTAVLEEQRAKVSAEVEAFSSDPANIYFQEVAADVAALLKSRVATTLKDAYERAVYSNPVTRQKELDRLTAENQTKAQQLTAEQIAKARKATGANIDIKPRTKGATVPVGTMDDTLNETMAAIAARG